MKENANVAQTIEGAKAFRIACVYFKEIRGSRRSDRPRREESEAAKDL